MFSFLSLLNLGSQTFITSYLNNEKNGEKPNRVLGFSADATYIIMTHAKIRTSAAKLGHTAKVHA